MDQAIYHPGPVEGCLLTRQEEHRSQLVWDGKILEDFRLRTNFKSYWDLIMEVPPPADVLAAISDAGLYGVYCTGMMRHDAGLISAFVDRWRPETHTFHFRFGEATITLEDVYHILGLRSTGLPVVTDLGVPDAGLVHELLGVVPEPLGVGTPVIFKGGLNISWLVERFGRCARLQPDSDDYATQLVFHIRAHLLLIIGSLFPNSTGNRLPLRLLHYVRDLTQVGHYSWGSACLAYLYKNLCTASIGRRGELCGSMTLLQVWIYERFRGLAPTARDSYFMQHPRALRWIRIRMTYVDVPDHSSRGVRYELDTMSKDGFIWRPYLDSAPEAFMIDDHERALMTTPSPLIFEQTVEWCYTDRVTRQFGFLQMIPTGSPLPGHSTFHGRHKDWHSSLQDVIQSWHSRGDHMMEPPRYRSTRIPSCSDQYNSWYDRVTRRYIINPLTWSEQRGCQGTQGHLPIAAEGISRAYHIINHSGIAPEEPPVDDALQVLHGTLDATGFSELHDRLPPPPPPTRSCRGARTRGALTGRSAARLADPSLPPRDGWVPWVQPTVGEGSFAYSGSGWDSIYQQDSTIHHYQGSDGHASGQSMEHGGGSQHFMSPSVSLGHAFGGSSIGDEFIGSQHLISPPNSSGHAFSGSSIGDQFIGSQHLMSPPDSSGHAFGGSSFHTPVIGLGPFPSEEAEEEFEEEEALNVQWRKQPRRAVKGKGRLCHTGGRLCGPGHK